MTNKLAKLYARRPDLAAEEGLYFWESVGGTIHGGKVTELDGNDVFVECETCGKTCCVTCGEEDILDILGKNPRLRETSFVDLGKYAVSSLTDKHLEIRYTEEYRWAFKSAIIYTSHDLLEIVFLVYSTFKVGNPLPLFKSPFKRIPGYYTVAVRCYKISEIISLQDWRNLTLPDKTAVIELLLEASDCKVYSDDPSFYYQGVWEDLYKKNLSIFKFPGPAGDGKWSARHGDTKIDGVHLTKHLAQLAQEIYSYSETIAAQVSIK